MRAHGLQISANGDHCLAATKAGTVFSWGYGDLGRLGLGDDGQSFGIRPSVVLTRRRHAQTTLCGRSRSRAK